MFKCSFAGLLMAGMVVQVSRGAEVRLVGDGKSRFVVRVASRLMGDDLPVKRQDEAAYNKEQRRRRLRESVRDLAHYFEEIAGTPIAIATDASAADADVAVLVGEAAQEEFGPVGIKVFGGQGYWQKADFDESQWKTTDVCL